MTDKYTDLENAVEKATGDIWIVEGAILGGHTSFIVKTDTGHPVALLNRDNREADAHFIALARTQVPELLADLKAEREEVERLKTGKMTVDERKQRILNWDFISPTDKDADNE